MSSRPNGRPKIYDTAYIENEAIVFELWLSDINNVFANAFAVERGYDYHLLTEWSRSNKKFSSIYSRAKQMQEIRLLNGGLSGKFKEQMTKFVLVNHHNYAEKSETKVNQETSYTIKTINYNQPQATLQADQDLLEIEVKPSWSNQQSIQPIDN
jgi:hypothetical protein